MNRPLRIAITYIAYPVAMARYFHEALIDMPNIQVWSAGPFTGRMIPWGGGMELPAEYVLKPNHPMSVTSPPMISYPMLEKHKPWEPDLWLEVNAGLTALGKPTSAPLAMVLTDPHVLSDTVYRSQRGRADYVFNMQTPYMAEGDIWLPYARSTRWHTPTDIPFANRKYDAALIGLQYGNRGKLTESLMGRGHDVFYKLGLAYDDAKRIYHDTRVGFNWSSLQDTTARCYELMGFGISPVMNRVPDLMSLFKDGEEFLGFDTLPEAIDQVERLLADPDFADYIALNAQVAVEKHTWENRILQILKEVGLI